MNYNGELPKYRHELKFIINKQSAEVLKQRLSLIMDLDSNSYNEDNTYLIRSLYFDDLKSSAYYEKIDGVEFRKKYRIRLYNNDKKFIRLECKHKHNNLTYKEQVLIDYEICSKLISCDIENMNAGTQDLLSKFLLEMKQKHLVPSVIVDYKRLAYTYPISDVRITFDSNIKSGAYNYELFNEENCLNTIIDDNEIVLEVKYNEIMPESIAIILSTIPMYRQAYSKFATCRSIK